MTPRELLHFDIAIALRGVAGRRAGRRPYWALEAEEARLRAEEVLRHLERCGWRFELPAKHGTPPAEVG
ncbi:MAG: hypothetical protein RLO50_13810 [Azospirillaceae bacterium]